MHPFLSIFVYSARKKGKVEGKLSISAVTRAPSDQDSAIDEPDQSGDDDNLLVSESNLVLVHRPKSLHVKDDDNYETSV